MSTCAVATREQSLTNLCIAFNGESNAAVRYAAFAKKADEEGYLRVGSLFRAVARSEQIHAANHAATMLKMGRLHRPTIEMPRAKTTIENLNAAVDGEFYEVNEMYPDFILEAAAQALTGARRTFQYALAAERGHLQLFLRVLEKIEHPDARTVEVFSRKAVYYICPECGFTAEMVEFDGCPVCRRSKDEFELIS
jgi:rubrerythrin